MSKVPTDIQAVRTEGVLRLTWGERKFDFPFAFLRGHCDCAHCVNEWTGERILDPADVLQNISVEKLELVGSYALRIHWSDGHNSGLYTWDRLKELASLK